MWSLGEAEGSAHQIIDERRKELFTQRLEKDREKLPNENNLTQPARQNEFTVNKMCGSKAKCSPVDGRK